MCGTNRDSLRQISESSSPDNEAFGLMVNRRAGERFLTVLLLFSALFLKRDQIRLLTSGENDDILL